MSISYSDSDSPHDSLKPLPVADDHPRHANVQMAGWVSARFRAGMRPLAVAAGLCVALSAPIADFLLERHDLARRAVLRATELANTHDVDEADLLSDLKTTQERRPVDEVARVDLWVGGQRSAVWTRPVLRAPSWFLVWGEATLPLVGGRRATLRVAVEDAELHRDLLLLGVSGALGLMLALALYFFPLGLFREQDLVRLFAWRSLKAAEDERLRLSRDLHDGIGQALGATAVALARLSARVGPLPETLESARLVDGALDELRRVARGLRPPSLDDLGLGPAVEALVREAERTGLRAEIAIDPLPRLSPEVEQTCFRLAQEALANIIRHARAQSVRVSLSHRGGALVLQVQDDGQGFTPGDRLGLGLVGARERAERLSGQLTVESAPGAGARLTAVLPFGGPG